MIKTIKVLMTMRTVMISGNNDEKGGGGGGGGALCTSN